MGDIKPISEADLLLAIRGLLSKTGYLNKLSAEVRSQVTELIRERQAAPDKKIEPPQPSEEVLLINELVREYLEWNGYLYTASVMTSEAALPKEKKSRSDLCAKIGARDDEKSLALPLLSNIVAAYTERIKRKLSKGRREMS